MADCVIAGTGHRPSQLFGFDPAHPGVFNLKKKIIEELVRAKPIKVLSGMAQGFDIYLAECCLELKIPYIACVPFIGQEKCWPKNAQEHYHKLLNQAKEIIIVSSGGYAGYKMQIRNQYLVDNANLILACFKPGTTSGGTFNCVQYTQKMKKEIIFINPDDCFKSKENQK